MVSMLSELHTTTSAVPDNEGHAKRPSGQEAVDRLAAYLVSLDNVFPDDQAATACY